MTTASLVCGVDDSRHARFALKVAERYARKLELRLIVVHVSGHVVQPSASMNPSALPLASHEKRDWTRSLDLVERLITEESINGAEAKALLGDPAECLADAADDEQAELIVVGSRGLGAFRSAFLGSVSNALVGIARCPVLVVPRSATADALHAT